MKRAARVSLTALLLGFYLTAGLVPVLASCHATQPVWAAPLEDGCASGAAGASAEVIIAILRHRYRWDEEQDGGNICGQAVPDGGVP